MIIKGFQPLTTLDYPQQLAALVFTAGCNMRCTYCYNKSLVENAPDLPEVPPQDILQFLQRRKGLLDGVVISGGEPTMHADLPDFIKKIKQLGFKVKLDTNGTNPKMVQDLLNEKLIDYIAMDVKQVPAKYEAVTKLRVNMDKVEQTVAIIKSSDIDYEFRTTAAPSFISKQELLEIGKWLQGSKKYCLQQFKAVDSMNDMRLITAKTYEKEELDAIKEELAPYFREIEVRT